LKQTKFGSLKIEGKYLKNIKKKLELKINQRIHLQRNSQNLGKTKKLNKVLLVITKPNQAE